MEYQHGDTLIPNLYNIPEPIVSSSNILPSKELDLVVIPLVAFDNDGHRLGMGAGYYDRTFEFIRHNTESNTKLVGIAYEFQHVEEVKTDEWDVPLNQVATELQVYYFS